MPPRPTIKEHDIEEAFLKGSGPGGQKIVPNPPSNPPFFHHQFPYQNPTNTSRIPQNKTSSAVQLKHIPTGIVIKSQETRSRTQNRKIARRVLAEKLEVMEKGKESRVMVKGEVARKKKSSKSKKANRKYKKLGEEGGVGVVSEEREEGEDAGVEDGDVDGEMDGQRDGRKEIEKPVQPP
ncbi:MAG: hypothetical protein M1827_003556 [Pycnora praestabilis]|nr:MAG: hypothetical protein M1827_003556 [Pycnora praestabilis]